MTAALNRLQKQGYVTRVQDPDDGRCFQIHLTNAGQHVIQQAYGEHTRNLEKVAAVLTVRERSELVRLLKQIGTNAERNISK